MPRPDYYTEEGLKRRMRDVSEWTTQEMADSVYGIIEYLGSATFSEITLDIGTAAKGDKTMHWPERPNIVLWSGLSEEVIASLTSLLNQRRVEMVTVDPSVYMATGYTLHLPPIRNLPDCEPKELRWLPVAFKPVSRDVRNRVKTA